MVKTYGNTLHGFEISPYGKKNGFVDYGTLSKAVGDMILNNGIMNATYDIGYWEQVSGYAEDEDDEPYEPEIYQTYIISDRGAELLVEAGEIVYYNAELDIYLWGVTHWGTGWDYVLTNIKITSEEEFLEQLTA